MGDDCSPADVDLNGLMEIQERNLSEAQLQRFEEYIAEIFTAFGLDLSTPATRETPRRYLEALREVTSGYGGDVKLIKAFDTECRGGSDCQLSQVIEGPISFFSLCEHHALPFYGQAYVGYIPHEQIFGISKLNRLVRIFARRFAVQERIGRQIADTLTSILQPHGVAIYIEAHHLCVEMRGVREKSPTTRTTHWRGNYEIDPALREEFLTSCSLSR